MSKIESFNSKTANALADEIVAALQPIAEKYSLQIGKGRGSFTASNFSIKLEVATTGEGGVAKTREYTDLLMMLPMLNLGITVDNLDDTYFNEHARGRVKIVGYRMKAPKRPFIVEAVDGPNKGNKFFAPRVSVEAMIKLG